MELKDIGMILRSIAETWCEPDPVSTVTDYIEGRDKGWNDGAKYCGNTLNDLLDKCDVPQLEPESDSDE